MNQNQILVVDIKMLWQGKCLLMWPTKILVLPNHYHQCWDQMTDEQAFVIPIFTPTHLVVLHYIMILHWTLVLDKLDTKKLASWTTCDTCTSSSLQWLNSYTILLWLVDFLDIWVSSQWSSMNELNRLNSSNCCYSILCDLRFEKYRL